MAIAPPSAASGKHDLETAIVCSGKAAIGNNSSGPIQAHPVKIFHDLIHFPHTKGIVVIPNDRVIEA